MSTSTEQFAPDIDPVLRTIRGSKLSPLSPAYFQLFVILYRADLAHGDHIPAEQLCVEIGAKDGRPRKLTTLKSSIRVVRFGLEGTRFAVDGDPGKGYRLTVRPLSDAPPRQHAGRRALPTPHDEDLAGVLFVTAIKLLLGKFTPFGQTD